MTQESRQQLRQAIDNAVAEVKATEQVLGQLTLLVRSLAELAHSLLRHNELLEQRVARTTTVVH